MNRVLEIDIYTTASDGHRFYKFNKRVEKREIKVKTPSLLDMAVKMELKKMERRLAAFEEYEYRLN